MESTSAVTGPRITGPRGVRVVELIDRDGSISTVGATVPPEAMPLEEITAAVTLLEVPGPAFSTPPSMLQAMISAELDCGLLPRADGKPVPPTDIWPELISEPPEKEVGQLKPVGAPVSLAQEWMPPLICMPTMPGPVPDRPPVLTTLPFTVPSSSTMMELDWVELSLAFWMMP